MTLESSLSWIVSLLRDERVPFVVTGGFAAHLYGSGRPVNDIDLDIPHACLPRVASRLERHVTFGPQRFCNEAWDLTVMTLEYDGQEIDISGAEDIRVYDPRMNEWRDRPTDLRRCELVTAYGLLLPVMRAEDLLSYKEQLAAWGQVHQRQDVQALRAYLGRT